MKTPYFYSIPGLICLLFYLATCPSFSTVREFETTRLKSTGGAGIGSILMDEAAILNPAPIAFFNISSIYMQKMNTEFSAQKSSEDSTPVHNFPKTNSKAIIAGDAKGQLKGSISYQVQEELFEKRKRLSASFAQLVGKFSSLGIIVRKTTDIQYYPNGPILSEESYNQIVLGASHVISPNFTLGIVIVDPLEKKVEERKLIVGFQYVISSSLSLIFDSGLDYREDFSKEFLYKAAAQIGLFSDFYLRLGIFQDKGAGQSGNGIGIGWVGPKLVFDLALSNIKPLKLANQTAPNSPQKQYTRKDLSFSMSYHF